MLVSDNRITEEEKKLTEWWTQNEGPLMKVIDSIDIGWGGAAMWTTKIVPIMSNSRHIDFACGWGSFIAELGWRFPEIKMTGLNIDFESAHSRIKNLLKKAEVIGRCKLIQADTRYMPFRNRVFDSASCFLGLQDIMIGYGKKGIKDSVREAIRVVREEGIIFFVDVFNIIDIVMEEESYGTMVIMDEVFVPDIRWSKKVGEKAVEVYAKCMLKQMNIRDKSAIDVQYKEILVEMKGNLEKQLAVQGYYNPMEPLKLIVFKKNY